MAEQKTVCSIDLESLNTFKRYLENRTALLLELQKMQPNYPGDWNDLLEKTSATLRENMIKSSPGSELLSCQIYHEIWKYLPPIIIVIGTLGNLLSFTVLCRKSMIQLSSYIYLAVLALVDQSVLFTQLLRKYVEYLQNKRLDHVNSISCKSANFLGQFPSYLSVWLIVAVTIERAIVTICPFRANQLATPRRAKVNIFIIILSCILVNLHFFQTVDLIPLATQNKVENQTTFTVYVCEMKSSYATFAKVWTWLDAALYSYLPFGIITLLNAIIIYGVYKARLNRERMTQAQGQIVGPNRPTSNSNSSSSEGTRQLTILLLAISFLFLVCTTPVVVMKFLTHSKYGSSSIHSRANMQLADTVAEMLMFCNHSINFFLYCAMGNKFRRQLHSVICCLNRKRYVPNETQSVQMENYKLIRKNNATCIEGESSAKILNGKITSL